MIRSAFFPFSKVFSYEPRKYILPWSVPLSCEVFPGGREQFFLGIQGKAKKTRKFAAVKRLLNPKDIRLFVLRALLPVNWPHAHVPGRRIS